MKNCQIFVCFFVLYGIIAVPLFASEWELRFEKHLDFMNKHKYEICVCFGFCPPVYDEHLFKQEKICVCLQKIALEGSLDPLLQSWKTEENKNDEFLKEFACLTLYTYENIAQARARVSLFDLLGLYLQITSLPLPQLLDALDQMVVQLEAIMEHYPLEEKFTWSRWLDKYWWIPTFGSIWCLYTILQWYKNRPYR